MTLCINLVFLLHHIGGKNMTHIIIVGGVAGGATVASQLRRLNSDYKITVYEKDRDVTFANCGLPYYLGGIITKSHMLILLKKK